MLMDKIYHDALKNYGWNSQIIKTMEECGELTQALAKFLNTPHGTLARTEQTAHVCEELADVYIMVQQMALVFGKEQFEEMLQAKIERLNKRINPERI